MTNTDALQALADKVEAGEFPADVSARDLGLENFGDGLPIIKTMYAAFSGSLDAAKALHEALIPGWGWSVGALHGVSDGFVATVYSTPHPDAAQFRAFDKVAPARAWLLAIIRALIAQFPQQQGDSQ